MYWYETKISSCSHLALLAPKDCLNVLKVRNGWTCTKLSDTEEANLVRELHSFLVVAALKHLESEGACETITRTSGVNQVESWIISKTYRWTARMLNMRCLGLVWVLKVVDGGTILALLQQKLGTRVLPQELDYIVLLILYILGGFSEYSDELSLLIFCLLINN